MTEDKLNYEEDLAIDLSNLHEECLLHPLLSQKYGNALANAKRERDTADENVKRVRSRLTRDAMNDPGLCPGSGSKPTGPAVEAYYRSHEDHQKAKDNLIEAEHKVSTLETAVYSFAHRRNQLENLVNLHKSQWFAGPAMPKEVKPGKRMLDRIVEKTSNDQRERLNKKKTVRKRNES